MTWKSDVLPSTKAARAPILTKKFDDMNKVNYIMRKREATQDYEKLI